jgi:hypothetical protein
LLSPVEGGLVFLELVSRERGRKGVPKNHLLDPQITIIEFACARATALNR